MTPATPAQRLQTALSALRWSYGTLATECGVSSATVRRWASGAYPIPADILATLERLAEFHGQNRLPRKAA